MAKNIVIFSMSTYRPNSTVEEYTAENGRFRARCEHTNETALKYIAWKLGRENQQVDGVYAFLTDKARNEALPRFRAAFDEYPFHISGVPLYNNGDLEGAFKSVCEMFDRIKEYIDDSQENKEDVVIHFDITGGLRHSTSLILSLIQMLKYAGAKVCMVLYTNFTNHTVENADDLVDMFTLISGAEEFTNFGNVSQIQKYFENQPNLSRDLTQLLDEMRNLSETIKVCGSYDYMVKTLAKLKTAIVKYKSHIENNTSRFSNQEAFFAKLLPTIEREYAPIMPVQNADISPVDIIKWCSDKGFLQQTIVFYTEWLPEYLTDSGLVTVIDKSIIEECNHQRNDWTTWQSYFFRSYNPPQLVSTKQNAPLSIINTSFSINKFLYSELNAYLENKFKAASILSNIRGKNKKFENFLKDLVEFDKNTAKKKFVNKVLNMSDRSPIKTVLIKGMPPTCTGLENFLQTRIQRVTHPSDVVLSALHNMKKSDVIEMFDLDDKTLSYEANKLQEKTAELAKSEQKAEERTDVFTRLLNKGSVTTKLPKEKLIKFIVEYNKYVNKWRNKISHANTDSVNKQSNEQAVKELIDSLNLLTVSK